jgi:hypothetical protein
MITWRQAIRRALVSGSSASILSTAALMAGGQRDCASVFAPVNAVSHWLWKDRAIRQDRPSLRYTLVGYGIHHAMSILWAITYEKLVGLRRGPARRQGAADDAPSGPKHEAGPTVAMLRRPDEGGGASGQDGSATSRGRQERDERDGRNGPKGHGGRDSYDGHDGRGQDLTLSDVPFVPVLATAAVVAAGACLVDLRCTPQRLTPGFERHLRPSSLFLAYTAFGLGLMLCDSLMALRRR